MPDENTNPIGATQTSQNDQVTNNQIGDDFLLDFGEDGNKEQVMASDLEFDSVKEEDQQNQEDIVSTDIDLDSIDLFGEEKKDEEDEGLDITLGDNSEEEKEISEDTVADVDLNDGTVGEEKKDEEDEGLDIALSDNSEEEKEISEDLVADVDLNDETVGEEKKEGEAEEMIPNEINLNNEDNEGAQITSEDGNNVAVLDEEKAEEDDKKMDNLEVDSVEFDEAKEMSDDGNIEEVSINAENLVGDDLEKNDNDSIGALDEELPDNVENLENVLDASPNIEDDEKILRDGDENDDLQEMVGDASDSGDTLTFGNGQGLSEGVDSSIDHEDGNEARNVDEAVDLSMEEEGGGEKLDKAELGEDNDSGTFEDTSNEVESKGVDDGNEFKDVENDVLLEGDEGLSNKYEDNMDDGDSEIQEKDGKFSVETESNVVESEQDGGLREENGSENLVENLGGVYDSGDIVENENKNGDELQSSESQDDIGMSFDLQFDGQDSLTEVTKDQAVSGDEGNITQVKDEELEINGRQMDYDGTFDSAKDVDSENDGGNMEFEEKDQSEGIEMKSTLSLDEIMDSELQSGKFSDNNQNFSMQTDSNDDKKEGKGKRIFIVAAGVCVFLMMGAVAYLALPNLFNNQSGSSVVVDDLGNQHSAPLGRETSMEENGLESSETTIEGEMIDVENFEEKREGDVISSPKVEVESVDPLGGDDISQEEFSIVETEDLRGGETPTPYVGEIEDDSGDSELSQNNQITVDEINNTISLFKSKGELYYSYAQETSDMRVYKHVMKILSLCDDYEEKISNREGIDRETYDAFNEKVNKIFEEIDEYNGVSEIKIINAGTDSSDGRNEEEKQEYMKYVVEREDA